MVLFKKAKYNEEFFKDNLRQYFMAAPYRGFYWYNELNEELQEIANKYALPLYKVVGVFAALSPQMSVDRNKKLLIQFLDTKKASHYGYLVGKALDILEAQESDVLNILNGNKIKSFYLNLLHPNKETMTTIDRHALACLFQNPNDAAPIDDAFYKMTDKQYNVFDAIYKEVSDELNILSHQLQATTWVAYRQIRNLKY